MNIAATLTEPLVVTVAAVVTALEGNRDPWWIISSAAAALHGARPIVVADVDVVLSVADAVSLFERLDIRPAPSSHHPRFRSALFGRWTANPLVVKFMAGFRLRDLDGVWKPVRPETRQPIRVGSATVYVPELPELRIMFERFGRDKDWVRIDLLDRIGR